MWKGNVVCEFEGFGGFFGGGSGGGGGRAYLAGFVLSDFVLGVFLAGLALAVGSTCLRDVDLEKESWLVNRACVDVVSLSSMQEFPAIISFPSPSFNHSKTLWYFPRRFQTDLLVSIHHSAIFHRLRAVAQCSFKFHRLSSLRVFGGRAGGIAG